MHLDRDTYALINVKNIKDNVKKIITKYNNYECYFGVVKADSYGHHGLEVVTSIIAGGCNYLAVAMLEEALAIRRNFKDIPILCLGIINPANLTLAYENNITITINSLDYAKEVINTNIKNLKMHIKLNTGMNRLGIKDKQELKQIVDLLYANNYEIEGIYTHIYNATNKKDTMMQINKYENMLDIIDKKRIKIFHVSASDALIKYKKLDFVNGCRLGIIMYGFSNDSTLDLKSTFSVYSKIVQINELEPGEHLGYNASYVASKKERIGVVSIGYADGIIRKNKGRTVYINDREYPIVGNICMDMLFVRIDDTVNVNDLVVIIKDIDHINNIANYLETIPYEVLCSITNRVPRIYISQ